MTVNRKRRVTPTCTLLRNSWISSRYFSRDNHAWCHLYWFQWAAKRRNKARESLCPRVQLHGEAEGFVAKSVLWARSRLMCSQDVLNVPCNSVFPHVSSRRTFESIIRNRFVRAFYSNSVLRFRDRDTYAALRILHQSEAPLIWSYNYYCYILVACAHILFLTLCYKLL